MNSENTSNPKENTNPQNSGGGESFFARAKKIAEARKKNSASAFFNLEPDESKVVRFVDPEHAQEDEIDNKWKEDKKRLVVRYKVREVLMPSMEEGPEKTWTLSWKWSEAVRKQLEAGHRIFQVERTGSSLQTNYSFVPLVQQQH
jgi:hypothetical protein